MLQRTNNNYVSVYDEPTDLKSFVKQLIKNKYFIGGSVLSGLVVAVRSIIKTSFADLATKLLPNFSIMKNITLLGVPVGSYTFNMLGVSVVTCIVTHIIKGINDVKSGEQLSAVILREASSIAFLIISLTILGKFGMSVFESINNLHFIF